MWCSLTSIFQILDTDKKDQHSSIEHLKLNLEFFIESSKAFFSRPSRFVPRSTMSRDKLQRGTNFILKKNSDKKTYLWCNKPWNLAVAGRGLSRNSYFKLKWSKDAVFEAKIKDGFDKNGDRLAYGIFFEVRFDPAPKRTQKLVSQIGFRIENSKWRCTLSPCR